MNDHKHSVCCQSINAINENVHVEFNFDGSDERMDISDINDINNSISESVSEPIVLDLNGSSNGEREKLDSCKNGWFGSKKLPVYLKNCIWDFIIWFASCN